MEFINSDYCQKYLKEVAENVEVAAKPFPCPYLAVLTEGIVAMAIRYQQGELLCYRKSIGFKSCALKCAVGTNKLNPFLDDKGLINFTASCEENELTFTLTIADTKKI